MKQITQSQHHKATTTPIVVIGKVDKHRYELERFAKVGESQKDAIKRLMSQRKRLANRSETRNFSKDLTNLNNTKAYVENYYRLNALGPPPFTNLCTSPTTWPEGPEVEFSEEPELATQE